MQTLTKSACIHFFTEILVVCSFFCCKLSVPDFSQDLTTVPKPNINIHKNVIKIHINICFQLGLDHDQMLINSTLGQNKAISQIYSKSIRIFKSYWDILYIHIDKGKKNIISSTFVGIVHLNPLKSQFMACSTAYPSIFLIDLVLISYLIPLETRSRWTSEPWLSLSWMCMRMGTWDCPSHFDHYCADSGSSVQDRDALIQNILASFLLT